MTVKRFFQVCRIHMERAAVEMLTEGCPSLSVRDRWKETARDEVQRLDRERGQLSTSSSNTALLNAPLSEALMLDFSECRSF